MNEDRTVTPIPEEEDLVRETSTRTVDGVIPSGYGSSGGYIPPQHDGAEEDDRTPDDEVI